MKNKHLLCGIVFLLSISGKAIAERGSNLPNSPHIAVTGFAELSVKPDSAIIKFNLTSKEDNSLAAKQVLDDKINQFLDAMSEFKLTKEDVVASRVNVRLNRYYINNQAVKGDRLEQISYHETRDLSVTVADLSLLDTIINKALSLGVNNVNGITMKHSNEDALLAKANTQAISDAKNKGRAFTEAFNAVLGNVYSINVNSQNRMPSYAIDARPKMEMMSSRSDSSMGGQFIQDDITFNASISVVFEMIVLKN